MNSRTIPHLERNFNLEGGILVKEDERFVRKNTVAVPLYIFTLPGFMDTRFYATKQYFHVSQEGSEDNFFVHTVYVATGGSAYLEVKQECVNGIE